MELEVTVPCGNTSEVVKINPDIFGVAFNEPLVHQVCVAYMAGGRAGTRAQKTRAEVRGGGAKPWRQKGTGRARVGSIRNPIWVGGGRAFAAKPTDYSQKVNKKMYRGAMRAIIAELIRQGRMIVVSTFSVAEAKTKLLVSQLKAMDINQALIVTEAPDQNLYLAARNLPDILVSDVQGLNPIILLKPEKVVITLAALKELEERLA